MTLNGYSILLVKNNSNKGKIKCLSYRYYCFKKNKLLFHQRNTNIFKTAFNKRFTILCITDIISTVFTNYVSKT